MTVQTLINTWAAQRGDQAFLIAPEPGEVVTYAELREYVLLISAHLDAMGIRKGEHVATLMDNGKWTGLLFLAVMASGRVIVPLNAISGDSQLAYVLDHSDAPVVFASDKHLDRARKISAAAGRDITIIHTSPDHGPQWPAAAAVAGPLPRVEPADNALLIYTSGTTGKPKGVLLSHLNVVAGGQNTVDAHLLTANDRALCVLPIYHINAEIVTLMAPLVSGGSVVLPRRFSTNAFWELLQEHDCTWFSIVPTIVSYLLEKADTTAAAVRSSPKLARLRFGRSASSALPPSVHQAFEQAFGVMLVETMGLSETAAQILSNPLLPGRCKYGSPGMAYGNEVKVALPDGRDAAAGQIGEVLVRGDNVLKGYYKNPTATSEAIRADGWFHTGDLGYRDEDGFFFITGRSKELIIKGGENIAPREIDEALLQHPAVLEAAAYAANDTHYGQEVMAVVVLKEGKAATVDELLAFSAEELGRFKAPKEITIVQWLPKGPSGKVQRLKIAEILEQLCEEAAE